mmetsp:Transcript_25684/g.73899  ORF Transcript_25684/g.73899 Transcript_25684/m.73899 type:complete len:215 (-) Transcript_25684:201-845(-)
MQGNRLLIVGNRVPPVRGALGRVEAFGLLESLRLDKVYDRADLAGCGCGRQEPQCVASALLQPCRRPPVGTHRREPQCHAKQPHAVCAAGRRGSARLLVRLRQRLRYRGRHWCAGLHPRGRLSRRPCLCIEQGLAHDRRLPYPQLGFRQGLLGPGDGQGIRESVWQDRAVQGHRQASRRLGDRDRQPRKGQGGLWLGGEARLGGHVQQRLEVAV